MTIVDSANDLLGDAPRKFKKAAGQAQDFASDASDSILAYTRKHPAQALGLAAGAGALLFVVLKALTTSRD